MSKQALYDWCRENRPILALEMLGSSGVKQLALLNAVTGMDISADSDMELSSALFLDALKNQDGAATCVSVIGAYRDCIVTGAGAFGLNSAQIEGTDWGVVGSVGVESPDTIRAAATEAERARIMAILETCRPTEVQYSKREWAYEEKGKRDLFAKIMKALGEPVKEGGE